jgi:hypothetical protein
MSWRWALVVALALSLLASAQPAWGGGTRAPPIGTHLIGVEQTNKTFISDDNPYFIDGDYTIIEHVKVTFEPGTQIFCKRGVRINVDGKLMLNGSLLGNVLVSSAQTLKSWTDWDGIFVNKTGVVNATFATLEFSFAGLNATGGDVHVSNCTIKDNGLTGIRGGPDSDILVVDCDIHSSHLDGLMFDNRSTGFVSRNDIHSCQYGVVCFSEAVIFDNDLYENYIGMYFWNSTTDVIGNTVSECWDGVIAFYSDPNIRSNLIQGCLGNGTRFFHSNATFVNNVLEYNRVGLDIPYDSRGVLGNMSGNRVNGINVRDYYFYGVDGVHLTGLRFNSGWNAGFTGYLNGQGAFTFYDCSGVVVDNCSISNNWYGLGMVGSEVSVKDTTIQNVENSAAFLDLGSELTFTNVTYPGENLTVADPDSIALEYEYLKVHVRNESHVPIAGATVTVSENNVMTGTFLTGGDGNAPLVKVQDRAHSFISGLFVNEVEVNVSYGARAFGDNPRSFAVPTATEVVFTDLGDIWAPTVLDYNVSGGQQATNLTPVIVVRFSEAMNRTSVEQALTLTRPNETVPVTFAWDGWNLTVTVVGELEYSSGYALTLGTGAKDVRGNQLGIPLVVSFTTVGAPPAISDETLMYMAMAGGGIAFLVIILLAFKFRKKGPE